MSLEKRRDNCELGGKIDQKTDELVPDEKLLRKSREKKKTSSLFQAF